MYVLKFLYDRYARKLQKPFFSMLKDRAQFYSEAIVRKGSPPSNCVGFIDGTLRPICRPTYYQEVCHNGHKRKHCLKFQSVIALDEYCDCKFSFKFFVFSSAF